jgi:thiol:disulfide interchange protein DsbD
MEKEVFPHPTVVAALEDFVLLQADITRQDDNDIALSKHLDMPAPPALYFWNEKGEEMRSHRILGNVTAQQLASRAVQVTQ